MVTTQLNEPLKKMTQPNYKLWNKHKEKFALADKKEVEQMWGDWESYLELCELEERRKKQKEKRYRKGGSRRSEKIRSKAS